MFKRFTDGLKKMIPEASDSTALENMNLYPLFADIVGTYQKKGARCRYEVDGKMHLFKLTCENQTEQGTLIAENWTPKDAPAIWDGIDVEHAGTLEDPIPAVAGGMEYVVGKYYIEGGVIYLCKREGMTEGQTISLDFSPSQLVGHYFVVV